MQWRHFGSVHLFGGHIYPIRQLVVLTDLRQDLGELSFGREILHDDLGEALVLALTRLQPLISLFGYGDGLGGHRSKCVYLLLYLFSQGNFVFDLLRIYEVKEQSFIDCSPRPRG